MRSQQLTHLRIVGPPQARLHVVQKSVEILAVLFEVVRWGSVRGHFVSPLSWIYHLIARGVIHVAKDSRFSCYLFPRKKETIHQLRQLKHKEVAYVSFPAVH
jgi:hypothetical protein